MMAQTSHSEGGVTAKPPAPMPFFKRWSLRLRLACASVRESLIFDSPLVREALGLIGLMVGLLLCRCGKRKKGLGVLVTVHRHALSKWASARVERFIRVVGGEAGPLGPVFDEYVQGIRPTPQSLKYCSAPEKLFRFAVMVLKAQGPDERGVILLNYSHIYPLFAKLFNVPSIVRRYAIVLEPSWSGYCDLSILSYARYGRPVFVESIEPRDTRFLQSVSPDLIPVPVAGNWWVNHRVFRPLPRAVKDIDVCMIAGWAHYKRHSHFFRALWRLRRQGVRLRVLLLGYPFGLTRDAILQQAELYGVADQLEVHENLSPVEVNHHLNRAKVNVLWSRREGFNRAIIEAMFAGVPCIIREGMNYGYRYPYINPRTGRFSSEEDLPNNLLEMVETHSSYAPREWVMEHMTCQKGTAILNDVIQKKALESGEAWTQDIVVKTSQLNALRYWNPEDEERFHADYEFLRSAIRRHAQPGSKEEVLQR